MKIMQSIKVMTFNMLYGGHEGTPCSLENRKERILEVIRKEQPDIIGCQEVVDSTREWLEHALMAEYSMVGVGRNADCRGEGCPVFYRKDLFALLSFETFWLSDHPNLPGSRASNMGQSPCPRLAHCLHLRSYETGTALLFINTHLDHYSEQARKFELDILLNRIEKEPQNICSVLTGDFNLTPDATYFQDFLEHLKPLGWKDSTENIGGTLHEFKPSAINLKIDYILTNATVLSSRTVEDLHEGGTWYSDHYAVESILQI